MLFYPNTDVETLMDELGIPRNRNLIHVISAEKDLKDKVDYFIKQHFDGIYK